MKKDRLLSEYNIYGNKRSRNVLIQLGDDHDLARLQGQLSSLRKQAASSDWMLIMVPVEDWGHDLSPWKAPAAFGDEEFGDGASETLKFLLEEFIPALDQYLSGPSDHENTVEVDKTGSVLKGTELRRKYFLCGYSLAGLFALWAAYQTDLFKGVAAVSPSVWYRGWLDYARANHPLCSNIYLSLGTKEEKTRNPVMAAVGDAIREQYRLLCEENVPCQLDFNPGGHGSNSDYRMARGMAWLLKEYLKVTK